MLCRMPRPVVIALAFSLAALPYASFSQASRDNKKHERSAPEKNIWNYDGGIYFQSDGDLPNGPCFRISGRVIANDFFQELKRIDFDDADTVFRRGKENVTEFPERVRLEFTVKDFPCSLKVDEPPTRGYLTRPEIEKLRVALYWKNGVDLHGVEQVAKPQFFVHPRPAPSYVVTEQLQEKY